MGQPVVAQFEMIGILRDHPICGTPFLRALCALRVVESTGMDLTTSGLARSSGGLAISQGADRVARDSSESLPGSGRNMCSFAKPPSQDSAPQQTGQVLVMPPRQKMRRRGLWIRRVWLVVLVLFCLEIGIILTWCPWTKIWTENSLLMSFPTVRSFLLQNFMRGAISGVGLVTLWIGVAEAVRYREGTDSSGDDRAPQGTQGKTD